MAIQFSGQRIRNAASAVQRSQIQAPGCPGALFSNGPEAVFSHTVISNPVEKHFSLSFKDQFFFIISMSRLGLHVGIGIEDRKK